MDLKSFLPKPKDKLQQKHYWALVIEPNWVQAGIWKIEDGKAKIIFSSNPSAWELDEELINACDASLSAAIQGLPEDETEPSEAVFGVSASWVDGGEIKPEHLEKIKKVCSELSLTPVGFVVLPEALAHYIKSEEGSGISAVVIGVYKENLEVSLFSLGNLMGTTHVARSVSIAEDVAEGLSRFSDVDNLFSRFVLYDGKEGELENARQELIKVNWEDYPNIKLLHTPKIEIIDHNKKIQAVSLAGASEMADVKKVEHVAEPVQDTVTNKESETPETEAQTAEDLGFVMGSDTPQNLNTEEIGQSPVDETVPENEMNEGPVINDFIAESNEPTLTNLDSEDFGNVQAVNNEQLGIQKKATFFGVFLEKLKNLIPKKSDSNRHDFTNDFDQQTHPSLNHRPPKPGVFEGIKKRLGLLQAGKRSLIVGISFFVILLVAGFAWWWFVPKASLTIYVSPKRQEERITVKVDPNISSSNFDASTLKGEIAEADVSGDRTKATSGTKTIGDKANGEVTIYRVGSKLNLAAGTLVNGPSDLSFTLDKDIEIASGSAGSPGTTKVNVEAEDIGSQYNLASGTTFSIATYSTSDMEAKNEASFSGGNSREIRAVSEEDIEALEEELTIELTDEAKEDLKSNLSQNQYFVEESLVATASAKSFSAKVGDEAESLKLTLNVGARVLIINKDELLELASKVLASKVPEGFVLRKDQINVDFEFESEENGIYEFSVNIDVNLLPDVKTEEIVKQVRGRYPSIARDFMTKEVPGFVRAEIKIKPSLPGRLNTLPRVAKNIEVTIAAEK